MLNNRVQTVIIFQSKLICEIRQGNDYINVSLVFFLFPFMFPICSIEITLIIFTKSTILSSVKSQYSTIYQQKFEQKQSSGGVLLKMCS